MASSFLDNLSLSRLIAPVSGEEFRARYWEQQPLIVQRKTPDFYGDLFTLEDFDQAITRSPDYVKMANAGTKKNTSYNSLPSEGLEAVLNDMRAGSTLVLDQLHHKEPKLRTLCRVMAAEFGHRFQTNLYLTPPNGQGFSPHWDNHDVFILQVVGSKAWKIEKLRRLFPMKSDSMGDEGRELVGDVHSFVLQQGDLIYIPRGFVHAAECGDEPSLHVTLGVTAVFWEDLLNAAVKAAILQDERLRTVLPLDFMNVSRETLVKRLRGMLRDIADESFLGQVLNQYFNELIRTYQLDVSGQIVDFFTPAPLGLDDIVGPRRAIAYRMHPTEEGVRLFYGARTIDFPELFREALEFALRHPGYAARELPGDLQDEERIAFVERLLEEGLVVRKQREDVPPLPVVDRLAAAE
jgi:ribosomal protein L16 Arg81 hydroxylase